MITAAVGGSGNETQHITGRSFLSPLKRTRDDVIDDQKKFRGGIKASFFAFFLFLFFDDGRIL